MVDIGIASASTGTDAVSRLRGGRSSNSDDGSGGFLDALTSSGNGQNTAADADAGTAKDDDVATDQPQVQVQTDSLPDAITASTTDSDVVSASIASLALPASPTLPGAPIAAQASPATTLAALAQAAGAASVQTDASAAETTQTTAATPADTTVANPTITDATVADAMATLGLTSQSDVAAAATPSATPQTTPDTPPQNAQTTVSTPVSTPVETPTVKPATPQLPANLAAVQQQPSAAAAIPVSTDTPVAAQPAADGTDEATTDVQSPADLMQQLANAVAGDNTATPPTDQAPPTVTTTPGKAQTAQSTGDSKTDTSTDDDTSAAAASASSGAISDALSLLTAATTSAAQTQAAASALPNAAAAGQLQAVSAKSPLPTGTTASAVSGLQSGKGTAAGNTTSASADSDTLSIPSSATAAVASLAASGTTGGKSASASSSDDSSTDTFRVARATGKSQAVDMSVAKSADDSTQVDVKATNTAGTGAETVTVLDSRRYLGLADGSNSALVASTLANDKGWASALRAGATAVTGAVSSTSKVVNTLKIQMNPEKLGSVTATMRLSGDALSVDLKVQSAEAYRQLSSDQSSMVDSLRSQGYQVDKITVTYAPQQTSDSTSQQNSQSSFQGQQQSGASQGQQGGEAQSRRQNSGQRTNDQDGIWGTQTGSADDSLAGNAQRTRSTGVYL